jgi:hypothetical protein
MNSTCLVYFSIKDSPRLQGEAVVNQQQLVVDLTAIDCSWQVVGYNWQQLLLGRHFLWSGA